MSPSARPRDGYSLATRPEAADKVHGRTRRVADVLAMLERMGNQLPPRLKAILNLAISLTLVLFAIPLLWLGIADAQWADAVLGAGLALLAVFNLFT